MQNYRLRQLLINQVLQGHTPIWISTIPQVESRENETKIHCDFLNFFCEDRMHALTRTNLY
ncbi:hypothetical protein [uncultured Helicobacter sp.]|uniref:hypothetical protein n=1 Tax=uncultured Helicobacter sp. TaxID=175537 RepID=UPI002633A889|nr:hypothetical protein [uncultured Helicobacter sp.]